MNITHPSTVNWQNKIYRHKIGGMDRACLGQRPTQYTVPNSQFREEGFVCVEWPINPPGCIAQIEFYLQYSVSNSHHGHVQLSVNSNNSSTDNTTPTIISNIHHPPLFPTLLFSVSWETYKCPNNLWLGPECVACELASWNCHISCIQFLGSLLLVCFSCFLHL